MIVEYVISIGLLRSALLMRIVLVVAAVQRASSFDIWMSQGMHAPVDVYDVLC